MSRMSISMCENEGVPSVITICVACAASATRSDSRNRPLAVTRSSSSCGAGLSERHAPLAHGCQPGGIVVDPDHPQATVRERQRQRQPDSAEADHGHLSGALRRGHSSPEVSGVSIRPARAHDAL